MKNSEYTPVYLRDPLCTCGTRMLAEPVDSGPAGLSGAYYCPLHRAAPDLLEALKNLLDVDPEGFADEGLSVEQCRDIAHAAIAKAEGGS